MDTDLFRKLCFGVKFSKPSENSAPTKQDDASETTDEEDEGTEDNTVDASPSAPSQGDGKKKKKKKKKQGTAKQQHAQEINELKNRHRIHTIGQRVPDPVVVFEDLQERSGMHKQILRNVNRAGFTIPTPVQMQAIPIMMERRNIMAGAPTGSGKTASFVIPVLHHLQQPDNLGVRAVILGPTRELAKQTLQVCRQLSEGIGFRCHYIDNASKAAKFGPNSKKSLDILVSTPNRLVFMLKHDPPLIDLSRVQWLVIDESDKLMEDGETGFKDQLDVITKACTSDDLRRAFFSATFCMDLKVLCSTSDPDFFVQVNVGARNAATDLVKQELLFAGSEAGKRMALRDLIRKGITPPVLIFVQSKQRAKELYTEFMYDSVKLDVIHADKTQAERDATMQDFKEGRSWVLVCTELMGRGIDFKGINLVINYDFPINAISYIHRIGRTGRAGVPGKAITFFTEDDVTHLRSIANIMKASGCEVPEYMLKLKKPSKSDKKRKFPVRREKISTALQDRGTGTPGNKRKREEPEDSEQPAKKKRRKQKHKKPPSDNNNKQRNNNNNNSSSSNNSRPHPKHKQKNQPKKLAKKKGQQAKRKGKFRG